VVVVFDASFDVSTRQLRLSNNINAHGRGVGEIKKKVVVYRQRS